MTESSTPSLSGYDVNDGLTGSIFGDLTLVDRVGEGSYGTVYRARDRTLGVVRAVKVLHPGRPVGKFLQEARMQVQLAHPNIVQVLQAGEADGRAYLVTEYVGGGSLRDRMEAAEPIWVDEAVEWLRQMLAGIGEAHRQGLVHHDMKPENVLLTGGGVAKITDFGIARHTDDGALAPSRTLGTLPYMAPEQLERTVDPRSDLWAIGVIFREMVTGQPCFSGTTTQEIVGAIREKPLAPLSEVVPAVPPSVGEVVGRLLERDPAARYATAEEALAALDAARSGAPQMPMGRPRRRRWSAALGAVLVVVLGGGFAVWQAMRPGGDAAGKGIERSVADLSGLVEEVRALRQGGDVARALALSEGGKAAALADGADARAAVALLMNLAGLLDQEGRSEEAVATYTSVLERFPAGDHLPRALLEQGRLLLQLGRADAALRPLERLLAEFPGSTEAASAGFFVEQCKAQIAAGTAPKE